MREAIGDSYVLEAILAGMLTMVLTTSKSSICSVRERGHQGTLDPFLAVDVSCQQLARLRKKQKNTLNSGTVEWVLQGTLYASQQSLGSRRLPHMDVHNNKRIEADVREQLTTTEEVQCQRPLTPRKYLN